MIGIVVVRLVVERAQHAGRVVGAPGVDVQRVGAENSVTSCDLQILVEKTAEPVSS